MNRLILGTKSDRLRMSGIPDSIPHIVLVNKSPEFTTNMGTLRHKFLTTNTFNNHHVSMNRDIGTAEYMNP